ncbi:MAG: ABC transporter ATP-binding protein [Erysipelotrichaceae bacterium]|nr:ABC transporter ATP-binding protein [Erysipelotrichaceae bacterium]
MIKLENVTKNYTSFGLDVSLEVLPNRITGIIGQNGAGKSTTFKLILGLIQQEYGNITILNESNYSKNIAQEVGVVLADSGFSGYLTIQDLIPIQKAMFTNFDEAYFIKQCEKFGLPRNKKIKEFSTGMKVKLKVIVAMSHRAKLLILDEPTSGLDVIARDEVLELLRDFMLEDNHSIVISSHISSDLESLCDDLYMIHNGRIVLHEDTDVLLSDYAILKVTNEEYSTLDPQYIMAKKKENYGYRLLTNHKQYYLENYPSISIENGSIDDLMYMMIRGER